MDNMMELVLAVMGFVMGVVCFWLYRKFLDGKTIQSAEKEAERIVNRAKSQVVKIEKEAQQKAKDFEFRAKRNAENEIKSERQKLQNQENQLKDREVKLEKDYKRKDDQLQNKLKEAEEQMKRMQQGENRLRELEQKTKDQIEQYERRLTQTAQLSTEQAKNELMNLMRDEAERDAAKKLQQIEEEARKEADAKAKRILSMAISRYASEVATEKTTASLPISGEEMKGKIIGREGRNIRALEAACGVDVIIDENPETVIISSFDPIRREVAKNALMKLMDDGRVHPARIEEVVDKVKSELNTAMRENGEKACFDLGLHHVHPQIISVLGSLKYRQTEGQNILAYFVEIATLAGLIAEEIGYDVKLAKRAALLSAIGRGLDHSFEGSVAQVGAEFARKHGEKEEVVHAIRAHNDEVPAESVLDHIVQSAVHLAKARLGGRKSNMESFVKRLSDLESVANSFDGVVRSYALQTGKEIRVLVDGGRVTDDQSLMLSRDIARKIEREMNYPGQIKVAVIRETRIVEHAR